MLTVDTIAKIRWAFFAEKKPIKAICRELKRSPTAVRRAIPTCRLAGITPASLQLAFPICMHVPHMVVK
jgi:hypothetical protein